ncbi:MAG: hypothetical protein KQH63_07635 [Desulfobulbaceae bacterium]|nr:hypothetical protein [Desulfobulbaceae bacterium]
MRWIQLYFKPENEKFTYQISNFEFTAHGESVQGGWGFMEGFSHILSPLL